MITTRGLTRQLATGRAAAAQRSGEICPPTHSMSRWEYPGLRLRDSLVPAGLVPEIARLDLARHEVEPVERDAKTVFGLSKLAFDEKVSPGCEVSIENTGQSCSVRQHSDRAHVGGAARPAWVLDFEGQERHGRAPSGHAQLRRFQKASSNQDSVDHGGLHSFCMGVPWGSTNITRTVRQARPRQRKLAVAKGFPRI